MRKVIFLISLIFILPALTYAQWSPDPTDNVAICTLPSKLPNGHYKHAIPDGNGGAFIAWTVWDPVSNDGNIYAQHMDVAGNAVWPVNGVLVATATGTRFGARLALDSVGGVFITWLDGRNNFGIPDIYAQRLNSVGTALWTANGVAICTESHGQGFPRIVSLSGEEAIIAWGDERIIFIVYAQKVNGNGQPQWGVNGISTGLEGKDPEMLADGNGGAILTSARQSIDFPPGFDVDAQRIAGDGSRLWGPGGIHIAALAADQITPVITSTSDDNYIIAWKDTRNENIGNFGDIYAQKVNMNGIVQWTVNGKIVCNATGLQDDPNVVSDENAGAILSWDDERGGNLLYTQRIDANGDALWPVNGIQVNNSLLTQEQCALTSDDGGGAYYAWTQAQNPDRRKIFAQHISAAGNFTWPSTGVQLTTADSTQFSPEIVRDANCGMLVFWDDVRSSANIDIYGTHVDCNNVGTVAVKLLSFTGKHEGSKNLLEWETAFEEKDQSFTLEKSFDAQNFKSYKTVIGTGSINQSTHYRLYDEEPFLGYTYYRVKQTGNDGDSEYSGILVLQDKRSIIGTVYPNPTTGAFTIDVNKKGIYTLEVSVNSITGKQLYYMRRESITDHFKETIDLHTLPKGTYFIKLKAGAEMDAEKLIIF